jgi:hypothetical protein
MDNCSKLYRIRRTVHKMLKDRKYVVPRAELPTTKEEETAARAAVSARRQMRGGVCARGEC